MDTQKRYALILALALLTAAALVAMTWAAPGNAPLAGGSPTVVAYQGEVRVSATPYTGDGHFKFAVVNAAGTTSYWSNDGTSTGGNPPTAAVPLVVSDGLFSVLLGDTTLSGMTQALAADVFSQPDRYLRVWFSTSVGGTFGQLTPDTRIAAVPYALQAQEAVDADTVDGEHASAFADATHTHAPDDITPQGTGSGLDADTVDGLHANQLGGHYQNVVVVAKSGGDYTSVQAAIDSIAGAAADNAYLVWVAPGVYAEQVTMKAHVHLQGAGQEATVISSTASTSAWPLDQATLVLASDTSLRDLTLGNSGAGQNGIALLATEGTTRTLVADVTARALGSSTYNRAIFLYGSGTGVTLQQVTALAENGNLNHGLDNYYGATTVLRGGAFTARGGITRAIGIDNVGSATLLDAADVTVLAENSNWNNGMSNYNGAVAVLRGGSFTARGGTDAYGIASDLNSARLDAEGVTVLAENGSSSNNGLINDRGAVTTLHGGSFTARGGAETYGIASHDSGTTLDAEGVTALAEEGSSENHGLVNSGGSAATLSGGSFTGDGGQFTWGIYNDGNGTTLETESVTALGENASTNNFGLENSDQAKATLRSGSFTASGGTSAYGIFSHDSSTTLDAESVTALGKNSSGLNFGMENYDHGMATLRGGSFTGRGGNHASGVQNTLTSTLTAESITALAENGNTENHGLFCSDGVTTTLRGGSFTGSGGGGAFGIYNTMTSTLQAENVTALGKDSIVTNLGLYNDSGAEARVDSSQLIGGNGLFMDVNSGAVYLGVSQLAPDANRMGGTLTCYGVYDSNYTAYSCP